MHRLGHISGIVFGSAVIALAAAANASGPPFIYSTDGNNIVTYAADGTSTELTYADNPVAMAFSSSGSLFVALNDDGYVGKFTTTGSSSIFAGPFGADDGLAIDASGNIYVSQTYGVNKILKITPGGVSSTFASIGTTPVGLAFDANGNLYTANQSAGTIDKITPNGTVSQFISGLAAPTNIAFDASGNLYVCNDLEETGTVEEFSSNGTFVKNVASDLETPYSLAFDNSGDLFVGDLGIPGADNGAIVKVSPGGTTSTFAYYADPWAITMAPGYALTPEPGSVGLVLSGAMLLILKRRAR